MRCFLDALGLERVHYVGESIGGILGLVFAAKWPERLKSLTVCSSPTSIRPSARKALTGGDRELASELGKIGGGGWVKVLIEQKVISGKSQEHIDWVVQEWSKTPTHVLQGITRMLAGADIAPLLPQVKVPTLVIAPSRSPLTSLSDQLTIRNSIPDAQMALVEGPGHEIYVDEPEQCINALLRFPGAR
jgi:pimeloyl-ACP methyl ester carboxylesterase